MRAGRDRKNRAGGSRCAPVKIKEIAVKDIRLYDNNPRKNEAAVDVVARSIESFGFKVPVVLDAQNVIVCGHTRIKAAQKLGIESVPCVIADDLTDAQIKAFRIADNRTHEFAEWDFELLEKELVDIDAMFTGFDADEMEQFAIKDYSDLDALREDLSGQEDKTVVIVVPAKHESAVREWLAGEYPATGPGMGKGVLKKCGLL